MGQTAGHAQRFTTLDGLRGFAAILVLFFHVGHRTAIAVPAGYLAVDLFFGLSGFVLSLAYEDRLRNGLSLGRFTALRLIRIYPMAFLGAAIAVVLSSGRHPQSLLLLPDFGGVGGLFPTNIPLWSLAFEFVVNIAFAVFALRVGWRGLAAILIVSGAIVITGAQHYNTANLGALWDGAVYGLARTVFSFSMGVGMRRLHGRFAVRRYQTRLGFILPVALTALLVFLPAPTALWDLIAIFLFLPSILWLGTIWEAPDNALFRATGNLSYPLYCIHGTVIQAQDVLPVPPLLTSAVLIAGAWWLDSRVDQPIRKWLLRQLETRRKEPRLA